MKILKGIRKPRRGEHVLAVDPEMRPDTNTDWRRRVRFFNGRSVSHIALETEQTGREARLTLHGRAVSHGVIEGLEIGLENTSAGDFLHLNPGTGLTPGGNDVNIPKPLRVSAHAPQVYIPPETGLGSGHTERSLAEMIDEGDANGLPRAAILVLEPVTVPISAEADSTDPCEIDEQNDAFADWQWIDGLALTLCIWPINRIALPPFVAGQWRNHLAHAIFEAERTRDPDEALPWEEIGVPVGLVGFDNNWNARFVDRYAVVRAGGKPRRSTPLISDVGNPFLWQARMQHISEYMVDLTFEGLSIEDIATRVRYLPPAGILPRGAIEPRLLQGNSTSAENHFFRPGYVVEAIPVVLEQLDVVLEGSAGLAPFDLTEPDRVRVAVPVPQVWFEPNLLQVEVVDPEFQETLNEFALRRNRWLGRRALVRNIASTLVEAISNEPIEFPDPDPDAVGPETVLTGNNLIDADDPALAEPEETYGTTVSAAGELTVEAIAELRAYLAGQSTLRTALAQTDLDVGFEAINTSGIPGFSVVSIDDGEGTRLIYDRVMTEDTRDEIEALIAESGLASQDEATNAVNELYREAQRNELAQFDAMGLKQFIAYLEERVAEADDRIDLGFVQVQTNIYRLRQLMLGNVAASRLATSPALSEIAKGDTAAATREDIRHYLDNVIRSGELSDIRRDAPDDPAGSERVAGFTPTISRGFTGVASSDLFVSEEFTRTRGTGEIPPIILPTGGGATISPGGSLIVTNPGTTLSPDFTTIGTVSPISGRGGTTISGGLIGTLTGATDTTSPEFLAREVAISSSNLFNTKPVIPVKEAIVDQSYIVGKAYDFRNVTVAERLTVPEANEAKEATLSTKFEAASGFQRLLDIGLNVDDIEVPGIAVFNEEGNFETRERRRLADLARDNFADILRDPDPTDADEADYFSLAVQQSEHTIAMLRLIEGRIRAYKAAIERCKQTLTRIQQHASQADRRLKVIGEELAEGRHDVSVAMALLAEETNRIATINQRRDQIIAEHVDFLAYYRPRLSDNRKHAPARVVDNGLVAAPVPACLSQRVYVAPELREMVNLLREVPLKWLTDMKPLLDRLDRVDLMVDTIVTARNRAQIYTQAPFVQRARSITGRRTMLGQSLNRVYTAQHNIVSQYRVNTARLDLSRHTVGGSWQNARNTAEENVSLSDLIDAGHGRSDIVDQGTTALHRVTHVAACLYNEFAAVVPSIRLDWAERLSQYDADVVLRDLSSLPRWGEVERLERRDMQEMVDWLFQRIDNRHADAVSFMNDLVQVCILLASHAPVDEIVSAAVEEATSASTGSRVRIKIDPSRVRVGMGALIYRGSDVVAHALVDDLAGSVASVRVVKTMEPTVQLAAEARVQLAEPETLFFNPTLSQTVAKLSVGSSNYSLLR